jgi:hydroxymethylglutaryl-CoA synthase
MHTTLDWVNADSRRIGIVVATDNAKYELESTGEYTQGAGAVATLIKHNPRLLAIDNQVGISTISEHDFFKPVRKIKKSELIKVLKGSGNSIPNLVSENEEYVEIHKIFPVFDGQYSNKCYSNRMSEAYNHFVKLKEGAHKLEDWDKLVFHLPYAFHGKRAFADVFWATYKEDEKLKEQLLALDPDFFSHQTLKLVTRTEMYKDFVSQKVEKGQRASSYTGNLYTASIFMSFMSMLETELLEGKDISREKIGFCAYGSGSKSKVFEGEIQKNWKEVVAKFEIFSSLEKREAIDFETYEDLHNEKLATSIKSPKGFYLESISEDETLYGVRKYAFAK